VHFAGRIPVHFCRHLPPPAPAAKDIHTFLPAPHPGRGQCLRYQGSSRIRGGAGRPPCPALLQDLPMCWTVGISPLGVGLTGRGNEFPLPCLPRSKYLTSAGISHPTCAFASSYPYSSAGPHPARACGAPPPPHPGRGQCLRYQVSSRIRGFSRISPCAGPWGYRGWGWGRQGGGTRSPSPVSHAPNTLFPRSPTPPAPPGSSHEADRATIAMRKGGSASPAGGHL